MSFGPEQITSMLREYALENQVEMDESEVGGGRFINTQQDIHIWFPPSAN